MQNVNAYDYYSRFFVRLLSFRYLVKATNQSTYVLVLYKYLTQLTAPTVHVCAVRRSLNEKKLFSRTIFINNFNKIKLLSFSLTIYCWVYAIQLYMHIQYITLQGRLSYNILLQKTKKKINFYVNNSAASITSLENTRK